MSVFLPEGLRQLTLPFADLPTGSSLTLLEVEYFTRVQV